MNTLAEKLKIRTAERSQSARDIEADSARAQTLAVEIRSLEEDLHRFEARKARFDALGAKHVTVESSSFDPRFNTVIAWEPVRSLLSGKELAALVELDLASLRGEIARREAEIEELLAE